MKKLFSTVFVGIMSVQIQAQESQQIRSKAENEQDSTTFTFGEIRQQLKAELAQIISDEEVLTQLEPIIDGVKANTKESISARNTELHQRIEKFLVAIKDFKDSDTVDLGIRATANAVTMAGIWHTLNPNRWFTAPRTVMCNNVDGDPMSIWGITGCNNCATKETCAACVAYWNPKADASNYCSGGSN